ncbi:ATP-dependent RNA helicase dbp6 [Puttea exsequens]|nr:ATP-dependent RNA helicase dbp6 [Puttea exsequens]
MTSQFFNRYIPPPKEVEVGSEAPRPSKKRKQNKKAKASSTSHPESLLKPVKEAKVNTDVDAIVNGQGDVRGEKFRSETSSEKQLTRNSAVSNDDDHDLALRSRHQAVFYKYDRAARIADENAKGNGPTEVAASPPKEDAANVEVHGLEPLPQPPQVEESSRISALSALPKWLRSPIIASATKFVPFDTLPLTKNIISTMHKKGFADAFAIQAAVLPMLLPGPDRHNGDLCISAATGSGKTLAYVLPMVEAVREKPIRQLRGLIVVPTRELVSQVRETLDLCTAGTNIHIATAVGSKSLKEEQSSLIEKGQRYHPEGFKAEQEKVIDEDEELMDWDFEKLFGPRDDFEVSYNHVMEYRSKADILVCTPGRLVEHLESTKGFTLEHVQWLVIDEADRLLDERFQDWVDAVLPGLEYLPPLDPIQERLSKTFHLLQRRDVRKIILSATMTRDVSKLTALRLRRPQLVVLEGQKSEDTNDLAGDFLVTDGQRLELPPTLEEVAVKVHNADDKPLLLLRLLDQTDWGKPPQQQLNNEDNPSESSESGRSSEESPTSTNSSPTSPPHPHTPIPSTIPHPLLQLPQTPHGTLIFTRTNTHATRLALLLSLLFPMHPPKIAPLTSFLPPRTLRQTLSRFRSGHLSILVASDRASRGLDIPHLAHVINYDMPSSVEAYVHRVGRTARAGRAGRASTLVEGHEARWFWREVVRGKVGRGGKVKRDDGGVGRDEGVRERYLEALEMVGREARGEGGR